MSQYSLKVNSYLNSDTRIQVVKERSPKRELYENSHLDRNLESETALNPNESSSSVSRKSKRNRRTQNRLSPHARASLQRIGGVASVYWGAESIAFLTGTFPGSSHAAQRGIAEQASWIVHRLKAWIYKRIGANVAYWVWEFQKRGTLHLHYVVVIPDDLKRAAIIADFREEWIRLIQGASVRCGLNLFMGEKGRDYFTEKEKLQIYAQECYKNCGSYLSKYLAKKKTSRFASPCRLWGCTKEARHLVARNLITVEVCSKTLAQASEYAYQIDSYSNVGGEKRRYFRHRFSQGFTILLYDDNLRESLVKKDSDMGTDAELNQALSRISDKLLQVNAYNGIIDVASEPLKRCFVEGKFKWKSSQSLKSLLELQDNLIELGAIISLCPGLKYYEVNDCVNLISVAKCILIK